MRDGGWIDGKFLQSHSPHFIIKTVTGWSDDVWREGAE
jgi:hypothetical protein